MRSVRSPQITPLTAILNPMRLFKDPLHNIHDKSESPALHTHGNGPDDLDNCYLHCMPSHGRCQIGIIFYTSNTIEFHFLGQSLPFATTTINETYLLIGPEYCRHIFIRELHVWVALLKCKELGCRGLFIVRIPVFDACAEITVYR